MDKSLPETKEVPNQGKQERKGHAFNLTKVHANHHSGKFNTTTYIEDFFSAKGSIPYSKLIYLKVQHQDGRAAEVYDSSSKEQTPFQSAGEVCATEELQSTSSQPLSPSFYIKTNDIGTQSGHNDIKRNVGFAGKVMRKKKTGLDVNTRTNVITGFTSNA